MYLIGATLNIVLKSQDLTGAEVLKMYPVLCCYGGHVEEKNDNDIKVDLSSV
jgi:hypothetical protein